MTDHDLPPPRSGKRSFLTCFSIGCGAVLVLTLIAVVIGFALKDKVRNVIADAAYEGVEEQVENSSLESRERGEVIAQFARLRDGIKNDEVSFEELGELMEEVKESPLFALILTSSMASEMRTGSEFSEEERVKAKELFSLYLHGRVDGPITSEDDEDLGEILGAESDEGGFFFSTEEQIGEVKIRAAIEFIDDKVTAAGISPVEGSPDLSKELAELLDPILQ